MASPATERHSMLIVDDGEAVLLSLRVVGGENGNRRVTKSASAALQKHGDAPVDFTINDEGAYIQTRVRP